jgi:hypothetical protein
MNINQLLITGICATLTLSMTANAQGPGPGKGKGKGKPCNQASCQRKLPDFVIKKFDKDGDGKLNAEERKEAQAARTKLREANRKKALERFDADKDGKLSEEERKTMRETLQTERKEIHAAVLKKFDANDNGKIDPNEREGVHTWVKENYPDAIMHPGMHKHHGAKGHWAKGKKGKGCGDCNNKGRKGRGPRGGGNTDKSAE